MKKGIKLVGSSIVIAVIASVSAILIFQGMQSAFFSEVLKDTKLGNYTTKYASIRIHNMTDEHVTLSIQDDEQICKLKERESCYSRCTKVTVSDIKSNSTDIEVTDEILCEIGRSANEFGIYVKDAFSNFVRLLRGEKV